MTPVIARSDAPSYAPVSSTAAVRRRGGAHRKPRAAFGPVVSKALVAPAVAAALAAPVLAASPAQASPAHAASAHAAARSAATSSTAANVRRLFKGSPAPTAAVVARPRLRYGSRGEAVRFVQHKLGVHATGYFGPLTRAAVRRVQAAAGLRTTGVMDHATWQALGVTASTKAHRAQRAQAEHVPGTSNFGQRVLAEARRYSGVPYVYGGSTPRGFDCSGYVGYVFRKVGVSLPRTAAAIRARVPYVSSSSLRAGDLVFVNRGGGVSHVAIYAGGGYWFEASHPGQLSGEHRAWTRSVTYGRVSA